MKQIFFIILLFNTSALASSSYATSNRFDTEALDYATKITLNDNALIINHPECATARSGVHFSLKQQNNETAITLECAGKSYRLTESDFIEKAAQKKVNLSDLVESK